MKAGLPAILLFIGSFYAAPVASQSNRQDSIFHQEALEGAVAVYQNQIGDQSPLFNGSRYAEYPYPFKTGTPYFLTEKFTNGSVVYDGIRFDSLELLYDDLRQFLIVRKETYLLQLINHRLSAFTIDGHHFIRIEAGNSNKGIPVTGFYEILYPGRSEVLKITVKSIQEEPSVTEGIIRNIEANDFYYIKSGEIYVRVKSKKEMLAVFELHGKEVQKFIKKNKLNFRKDKNNTLVQVAEYYDQFAK